MGRRVLLVEGKDDWQVIRHLCRGHGIDAEASFDFPQPQAMAVTDEGGIDHVLDQIPVRWKQSDLERLALVVDADEDISARWRQIRDRFRRAGCTGFPNDPSPAGTIVNSTEESGPKRVGVWLMPDNTLPGMLEHFLAFLVKPDDTMLPRVDAFLGSIPENERRFSETHLPKARIHSFLALQKEPGMPYGLAITFKYLDAQSSVVLSFLDWLRTALVD